MKKLILTGICIASLLLCGCEPSSRDMHFKVVPQELKDCSFFELCNGRGGCMKVARCPNSVTTSTYSSGRSTHTSIVVDGMEYVPK